MKEFRYPGAKPFQEDQKGIFFGREKDVEDFYELVSLEEHVILYSKSGRGKSSLLNAGVIPQILEKGLYLPIQVRFGAYSGPDKEMPVKVTARAISALVKKKDLILEKIIESDDSLWYHSKNLQEELQYEGYILIFDQFEELFTYPEADIITFKKQLSELLHLEIPNRFREVIEQQFHKETKQILTEEELDFVHHPLEIKVIMSIRSDRMSLLNNLSNYLPNILKSCYELDALTVEKAEEAILNPAFKRDPRFITSPFDYEDEAIELILNYLTKEKTQKIESFQLQILCQALERKVIDQQLDKITKDQLDKLENLYENYYEDQINLLDTEEEKMAARKLIEEGLIFEEEERRLSMYEGQIFKSFGFTPELLNKLVNVHLLRAEPSLRGGYTYELSHDTIVAPILKAKRKRKAEEARIAAEAAKKEREKEIADLRAEAAKERKKRIQARIIAAIGIILAIIAITSGIYASKLAQTARQQVFDLIQADYDRLVAEGQRFQSDGNYQEALSRFEEALVKIREYENRIDEGGNQAKSEIDLTKVLEQKSTQYDSLFTQAKSFYQKGGEHLLTARDLYQQALELDINPENNRQAEVELTETQRSIDRAYKEAKERGDRYWDVGLKDLACKNYKIANRLNPSDNALQQTINRFCQ